ncbi:MAG: hypothetical protein M3367_06210 [Acidobacteriota bacterium]|nr:hypothetical protein [Acidobacteriota bacterium]
MFSLELAKVFIEENNLSKLSAFFCFCLKVSPAAASSLHNAPKLSN